MLLIQAPQVHSQIQISTCRYLSKVCIVKHYNSRCEHEIAFSKHQLWQRPSLISFYWPECHHCVSVGVNGLIETETELETSCQVELSCRCSNQPQEPEQPEGRVLPEPDLVIHCF